MTNTVTLFRVVFLPPLCPVMVVILAIGGIPEIEVILAIGVMVIGLVLLLL
jgi:hypothetical protein